MRDVLVVGAVGCLALLGEDHRHVIQVTEQSSDGDAACLDGEYSIHFHTLESTLELVGHLAHDVDVDLVVEETVNLEDVALLDDPVGQDLFF